MKSYSELLFTCLLFQMYLLNDSPATSILHSVMIFIAAITNYHKLNGLNSTAVFIIFQFCGSKFRHKSQWAKIKLFLGHHFFLEATRENGSFLFPTSRGYTHSFAHGPFFNPESQQWSSKVLLTSHHLTLLPLSHYSATAVRKDSSNFKDSHN